MVLVLANYVDVSYPFEKPPHILMVVADDMVCFDFSSSKIK